MENEDFKEWSTPLKNRGVILNLSLTGYLKRG